MLLEHNHAHAFTQCLRVYGCFHDTPRDLHGCIGDILPTNPNIFTTWPFYIKHSLTPDVELCKLPLGLIFP